MIPQGLRALAPDRCNITAVPADSKISAGACRPIRRAREKVSLALRLLLRAPDPAKTLKFAGDLYGAFSVKRLFWVCYQFFVRSGKAVLRPVACDQVPGARGRGQGTETLAQLGGFAA